jgi:hypothetical protein
MADVGPGHHGWDGIERRVGVTLSREEFRSWQIGGLALALGVAVSIILSLLTMVWNRKDTDFSALSARIEGVERTRQQEHRSLEDRVNRNDLNDAERKKDIEFITREIASINSSLKEITEFFRATPPRGR